VNICFIVSEGNHFKYKALQELARGEQEAASTLLKITKIETANWMWEMLGCFLTINMVIIEKSPHFYHQFTADKTFKP